MALEIKNSRDLPNTWRILDDKLGNFRERGLPFRFPYVGSFSQALAEWFIRVYSNKGDTVFDPFCICKNSRVLLNQQDIINIEDIELRKNKQINLFGKSNYIDSVMSVDINKNMDDDRDDLIKSSRIDNFFVKDGKDIEIYEISTRNGRKLNASGNHVFLTKNGNVLEWKQLKDIKFGDMVAVYPHIINLDKSIKEEVIILDEQDIIDNMTDNTDCDFVLNELQNAGLMPITNNHPKLYILARLYGFLMTDGFISEHTGEYERSDYKGECTRTYTHTHFTSGSRNSLLNILHDMELLGLNNKGHLVDVREKNTSDRTWGKCADLDMSSKTIYILFKSLGVSLGKKTDQPFDIPKWIPFCSKRVKQEFLGGLMGGDGLTIAYKDKRHMSGRIIPTITGGGFVQSKISELENYLSTYMSSISVLLKEFDIDHRIIIADRKCNRDDGKETVTYRIDFLMNHRNTLKFLRYIGYRYDDHKLEISYPIYEYLLSKENRIGIDSGISRGNSFPVYRKWKEMYTLNGVVFDEVIISKKIEYNDKLYDLSVENTNNYIVNGFVTHNSGRGTVAMQSLYHDRHTICNDLSPYSNTLCHSVLWTPYMGDVYEHLKILEEYILGGKHDISLDYAGKGSVDDAAKLYHPETFNQLIKLRNTLNSRDVLLGFEDNLFGDYGNDKENLKEIYTYRHEIVMFTRMVMSQLMMHNSAEMSFNGIKTRSTDNTNIKSLLKYYDSMKETPQHMKIFDSMRSFIEKMDLDGIGIKDKFSKLNRNMISCDARKLKLPDKCVDLVVTSPPYFEVLNYGMANWLRLWSLNNIGDPLVKNDMINNIEKAGTSEIHGKVYDKKTDSTGSTVANPMSYSSFTGQYLRELHRVLKEDGAAIIIVGDYGNKRKVAAWKIVADRAEIFGFKPQMVIMDQLNKDTKSSSQFQMKHDGGKNDYDVCIVLYKNNYKIKNNPENVDFRWGAKFKDSGQSDIDTLWTEKAWGYT